MDKIKIINIFKSIDGEAYHTGLPTIFLRTYGCNLRCAYAAGGCDTKESWSMAEYEKYYDHPLWEMTPEEAHNKIVETDPRIKHVTLTGGEPLLPDNQEWMKALAQLLLASGYEVDFETNGAVPLAGMAAWRNGLMRSMQARTHFIMDWKCPGSAMNSKMLPENLKALGPQDIVKCVVCDGDFDEVLSVRAKLSGDRAANIPIYISPAFGGVKMESIPEFVMDHPDLGFRCQIQSHKIFWDPTEKNR